MHDLKNLTPSSIDRDISYLTTFASAAALVLVIGVMAVSCVDSAVKIAEIQERHYSAPLTTSQEAYRDFFKRHGSPAPEQMAVAVTSTKRPALMAAIAVKESNGDPSAVGDSGSSRGAFQVQAKHWGKVSSDPVQQALQAERILEELVASSSRGGLRRGLAKYNGGTEPPRVSFRYADGVMALKRQVQQ
jgi:hypothetical protein